jgi:hypothetical protein
LGADLQVAKVKIWTGDTPARLSNSVVSMIDSQGTTQYSYRIGDATGKQVFEFYPVIPDRILGLGKYFKWHLAPPGWTSCDSGAPATQAECASAVATLASEAGRIPGRTSTVVGSGGSCNDGGWGNVPLGCSAQTGGDWAAHYKTSGVNCNSGYPLVCKFEFSTDNLCDQLLQQFHRVDEELSIQGKWQGGSVTGVCRGWGTNKVRSSVNNLGRLGDHWMACTHGVLFLCIQFLSLKSMYHIVDTVLSMDPDKNEIAIINVFEEFIGCAVSSLSSSLV